MFRSQSILFGYFHSLEIPYNASSELRNELERKREDFKVYVEDAKSKTKGFVCHEYGTYLELILFQFHLFENDDVKMLRRNVEYYRPKEKSIGINISIDNKNFFELSNEARYLFIYESMINRIEELAIRTKSKGEDFDVDSLLQGLKSKLL